MWSEVFIVLAAAVAVAGLARWRGLPAPLIVTGVFLAASLLPVVPNIDIDGHLLLTLTLPPLLYSASLEVSFIGFKKSLPQIRRLGIGLVVVTTVAVGLVAWWVMPELTLPGALLLGAIVAPPDAVSAAAIGRKLGLPRHVMTLMSGESLINDATSLTLIRVLAVIVAGATVTVWGGILEFFMAVGVGVAIGLALGIILHQVRMRIGDVVVTATLGLLVPFGAYAIAEHIGGSGVLAVVAMGLFVGYNAPKTSYLTRQHDAPLWASMDFLLESFVFAYIGLQFTTVLTDIVAGPSLGTLWLAVIVLGIVVLVRPIFVFGSYAWARMWQRFRVVRWKHSVNAYRLDPESPRARRVKRMKERRAHRIAKGGSKALMRGPFEPKLSIAELSVVSWAGMRGVVTLATAAALPDLTGGALAHSSAQAIFACAFVVTVGTLLVQGLTLAPLITALRVDSSADAARDAKQLEAVSAKSMQAGEAYLREQQELWRERYGDGAVAKFDDRARSLLGIRKLMRPARPSEATEAHAEVSLNRPTPDEYSEFAHGWLRARRAVLLDERDRGTISEEVMRELLTAVDAEELALDSRGHIIQMRLGEL